MGSIGTKQQSIANRQLGTILAAGFGGSIGLHLIVIAGINYLWQPNIDIDEPIEITLVKPIEATLSPPVVKPVKQPIPPKIAPTKSIAPPQAVKFTPKSLPISPPNLNAFIPIPTPKSIAKPKSNLLPSGLLPTISAKTSPPQSPRSITPKNPSIISSSTPIPTNFPATFSPSMPAKTPISTPKPAAIKFTPRPIINPTPIPKSIAIEPTPSQKPVEIQATPTPTTKSSPLLSTPEPIIIQKDSTNNSASNEFKSPPKITTIPTPIQSSAPQSSDNWHNQPRRDISRSQPSTNPQSDRIKQPSAQSNSTGIGSNNIPANHNPGGSDRLSTGQRSNQTSSSGGNRDRPSLQNGSKLGGGTGGGIGGKPTSNSSSSLPTVTATTASSGTGKLECIKYCEVPKLRDLQDTDGGKDRLRIRIIIDPNGLVLDASISKTSGNPQIDAAAIEGIRQMQFTPSGKEIKGIVKANILIRSADFHVILPIA
jgi:TonB family protein